MVRVEHARARLRDVAAPEGEAVLCEQIGHAIRTVPLIDPDQRQALAARIAGAVSVYWTVLAETPGDPHHVLDEIAGRARELTELLRVIPAHLLNNAMHDDNEWFLVVRDLDLPMPVPAPAVPRYPHQRESRLEMVCHAVSRLQRWAEAERERHLPRGRGQPRKAALLWLAHGIANALREFSTEEIVPRGTKEATEVFRALLEAVVAIADPQVMSGEINSTLRTMARSSRGK